MSTDEMIFVIDDPLVENLCDLEECERTPVRVAKLVARRPHGSPRSSPPACVGLYCCRKHADEEPLALVKDAQESMRGVKTHRDLWQALIDNYPEPIQIRILARLSDQRRLIGR